MSVLLVSFSDCPIDRGSSHTLDEVDEPPGATTELAQRVPNAPGGAGDSRARGAGDARQALRGLCCRLLGGLGGLLGGGALEAAGGELPEGQVAEHGSREGHGHCRGHLVCGLWCAKKKKEGRRGGEGTIPSEGGRRRRIGQLMAGDQLSPGGRSVVRMDGDGFRCVRYRILQLREKKKSSREKSPVLTRERCDWSDGQGETVTSPRYVPTQSRHRIGKYKRAQETV